MKPAPEYDAERDFAISLQEAYRVIRERMAAGGPPWRPKQERAADIAAPPSNRAGSPR